MTRGELIGLAGIALAGAGAWLAWRQTASGEDAAPAWYPDALSIEPGAGPRAALPRLEVERLAAATVEAWGFAVRPALLVAMAWAESSFRPWVIGDDGHAFGLMQVTRTTADWLVDDLGHTGFGRGLSDSDLLRADVSMYLGAAFADWLSRYGGVPRSEEWIVRAYNGGPGWDDPDRANRAQVVANTARHWGRVLAALA